MHKTFKMEDAVLVTVLTTGDLIQYTGPSFPTFKAMLRDVKLQWEEKGRTIHVFNAFACDCDQLDSYLLAMAEVLFDYKNAFIIAISFPYKYINYVIETF